MTSEVPPRRPVKLWLVYCGCCTVFWPGSPEACTSSECMSMSMSTSRARAEHEHAGVSSSRLVFFFFFFFAFAFAFARISLGELPRNKWVVVRMCVSIPSRHYVVFKTRAPSGTPKTRHTVLVPLRPLRRLELCNLTVCEKLVNMDSRDFCGASCVSEETGCFSCLL